MSAEVQQILLSKFGHLLLYVLVSHSVTMILGLVNERRKYVLHNHPQSHQSNELKMSSEANVHLTFPV